MKRRRCVSILLYLYPRSFRERFGDDIHDYADLRRSELEQTGRHAAASFTVGLVLELAAAALSERTRGVTLDRACVWCTALTSGLLLAPLLLGIPFLVFNLVVRRPLLLVEDGAAAQWLPLPVMTAFLASLLALALLYNGMLRTARKRRP